MTDPVCSYCGVEHIAEQVACDYCMKPAELIDSAEIYHGISFGPVWICRPCKAWVGTHKNSKTHKPLGRLANADLRAAKQLAHAAFDSLWKKKMRKEGISKNQARKLAYSWLAHQLEIEHISCHIGKFDQDQCYKTIEVCTNPQARKPNAQEQAHETDHP